MSNPKTDVVPTREELECARAVTLRADREPNCMEYIKTINNNATEIARQTRYEGKTAKEWAEIASGEAYEHCDDWFSQKGNMISQEQLEELINQNSHVPPSMTNGVRQPLLADILTELARWRRGGVTEDMLRAHDGYIKVGRGCIIARECDWPNAEIGDGGTPFASSKG